MCPVWFGFLWSRVKPCTSIAPLPHVGRGHGRGQAQDSTRGTCVAPAQSRSIVMPCLPWGLGQQKGLEVSGHQGGDALRQNDRDGSLAAPGKPMVPEGFQPWRQVVQLGPRQMPFMAWGSWWGSDSISPHGWRNWLNRVSKRSGASPAASAVRAACPTARAPLPLLTCPGEALHSQGHPGSCFWHADLPFLDQRSQPIFGGLVEKDPGQQ